MLTSLQNDRLHVDITALLVIEKDSSRKRPLLRLIFTNRSVMELFYPSRAARQTELDSILAVLNAP